MWNLYWMHTTIHDWNEFVYIIHYVIYCLRTCYIHYTTFTIYINSYWEYALINYLYQWCFYWIPVYFIHKSDIHWLSSGCHGTLICPSLENLHSWTCGVVFILTIPGILIKKIVRLFLHIVFYIPKMSLINNHQCIFNVL